jgi:hypothetical protein
MGSADAATTRDLRLVTWSGALAGASFLVLAWLTTQVDDVRSAVPFTEDPYDAVVSFALIGLAVVGGATMVRGIGHVRRPYDPVVARRIAVGCAIAVMMVAVTSDIAAVVALGLPSGGAEVAAGAALALLAMTAAATAVALARVWLARAALGRTASPAEQEPDLIDDLGTIVGSVGAARIADAVTAWAERSRFSPRRHRVLVGLLGAAVAGLGAVAWHAIREGAWASPAAAAVFGILMAIGVGGAYLLCLEPLRLLRPVGGRPTGTG